MKGGNNPLSNQQSISIEKKQTQVKNSSSNVPITLYDCLEEFTHTELINEVECPFCTNIQTKLNVEKSLNSLNEINHTNKLKNSINNHSINLLNENDAIITNAIEQHEKVLSILHNCNSIGSNDKWIVDLDSINDIEIMESTSTSTSSHENDNSSEDSNQRNSMIDLHLDNGCKSGFWSSSSCIESVNSNYTTNSVNSTSTSTMINIKSYIQKIRTISEKTIKFSRLPNLLCLHLNRRIYSQNEITGESYINKNSTNVLFPLKLNMSKYLMSINNDNKHNFKNIENTELNETLLYSLQSVIIHVGSADSGLFCFVFISN